MMETKKKTATITFHASHNYGSMLQAYALQQTLLGLGVDNEIINFRLPVQKQIYNNPADTRGLTLKKRIKRQIKRILISIIYPHRYRQLTIKYNLFESFLADKLKLTKEYNDPAELISIANDYTTFITGSDQCWNTRCADFDYAYYLNFTDSPNKISYASSIGPYKHYIESDKVKDLIANFKAISVRDKETSEFVSELTGNSAEILPDPTLLLSKKEWIDFSGGSRIIGEPYILLYTPHANPEVNEVALQISCKLGMPVVVSNFTSFLYDLKLRRNKQVKFRLDIGPEEFVNLIRHASLVISGSFHAVVFSIIMQTPFWAVNGNTDIRMKQILTRYGLLDRALTSETLKNVNVGAPIDFSQAMTTMESDRKRAIEFLKTNIS